MILSGIFLGGYGKTTARQSRRDQPGEPLAELVRKILALPDLGRLRLSSLEPGDLTPRLLDVIADSDKFANHLHLPLQSGSDAVLRRMGRQYSTDQYRQTIDRVRTRLPDMAFTTDIIVGFPGETQSAFKQTLHLVREVGFAKIHIFPFSPRQGTPAYRWQAERPSPEAVKRRLQHLRELEIALALAFRQRFLGRVVRVLVEKTSRREENTYCLGCADPYFPVRFAGNSDLNNQLVHVQIEQVSPTRLAVSGSLQAVVCS
jgi:threonylcarbamoyladenosine tRNA methylthiotransferase MtaB